MNHERSTSEHCHKSSTPKPVDEAVVIVGEWLGRERGLGVDGDGDGDGAVDATTPPTP